MRFALLALLIFALATAASAAPEPLERRLRFSARTAPDALKWQRACRAKLFALMMGGGQPARVPLAPQVLRREVAGNGSYVLEEVTIQSLPGRRAHLWVASPTVRRGRLPVVLAIHGHGGTGEEIVRGQSLYWYGKALAEMGYVVVAPDVGQHDLQHPDWTLMGERTWDSMRALDYAETRPDADKSRMAVCGLSLGGETTMYVGAMDTRLKAVDASGWLTTVANMRNGHCTCYDFPGLATHFDFSDIFGCIAPRPLVCEIGEKERAPGGFPVAIARPAFEEVRRVYQVFGAEEQAEVHIHPGPHVFVGNHFWPRLQAAIGKPAPWAATPKPAAEALRRAEVYRRAVAGAVGVLDGWMAVRDPKLGMVPRQVNEPVWAPSDNGADLMPFLFIAEHFTGHGRRDDLLAMLKQEQRITNRVGVLPDWRSFKTGTWVHPQVDVNRLIFCAAEYCKDGLMPMTEAMGRGPWTERMEELLDAIDEKAPVQTAFGRIPAVDTEVNGDLLQTLGRMHFLTGDARHLERALRIADAYCLEVIPGGGGIPAYRWDFAAHKATNDTFNLNDHGNEIILGLAETYIAAKAARPEKARQYKPALDQMFARLLDKARNADGLWVNLVDASTGKVRVASTPDTWGYALCAVAAYGDASGNAALTAEAEKALAALASPAYLTWSGADSYADSIEGAILLYRRFRSPVIERWLETVVPVFVAHQQPSGIVEAWYGDGNFARTALMEAFRCSQGAYCLPWKPMLGCGAVAERNGLRVVVTSGEEWSGKLLLDTQRHKAMHLPSDYPRLNHWPEWFTVTPGAMYRVTVGSRKPATMDGAALAAGLPLAVHAGKPITVRVEPLAVAGDGGR